MENRVFSEEAYRLAAIAIHAWDGLPNDEDPMSDAEAAGYALGILEACETALSKIKQLRSES